MLKMQKSNEEKEAKRKQDYVDEKMKLTEKELFVELLWSLDEMKKWDMHSIRKNLMDINLNTDTLRNNPMDRL